MSTSGLRSNPLARRGSGGRGLKVVEALAGAEHPSEVEVGSIAPNPSNPPARASEGIEELAASIREVGVITPLTIAPAAAYTAAHPEHAEEVGGYAWVMLGGHRRRAAAQMAGLTSVPVLVREDLGGERAHEVLLHENAHRVELTPLEEARAFARVMEERGLSQRQVAARAGRSQGHVSKRLALLDLPGVAQEAVEAGAWTLAQANEVLEVDPQLRETVARRALTDDVPVAHAAATTRREVASERARDIAKERAKALGARYADDPADVLGRNHWRHSAAGEASDVDPSNMLVTPGHVYDGDEPEPLLWLISRPEESFDRKDAEDRARKAATKARRAHLGSGELLSQRPDDALLLTLLTTLTLHGLHLGAQVTRLARTIAQANGVGPTVEEDWPWRSEAAAVTDPQDRHLLAFIDAIACLEDRAGTPGRSGWDALDRYYLTVLTSTGYTPTEWETDRLANLEDA